MVSEEAGEQDDEEQNGLRSVNEQVVDAFHNLYRRNTRRNELYIRYDRLSPERRDRKRRQRADPPPLCLNRQIIASKGWGGAYQGYRSRTFRCQWYARGGTVLS